MKTCLFFAFFLSVNCLSAQNVLTKSPKQVCVISRDTLPVQSPEQPDTVSQDTLSEIHPRSGSVYFYIDGIRVRGNSNLPAGAIEEVSVITGGMPTNYGDINSSIIWISKESKEEEKTPEVKP